MATLDNTILEQEITDFSGGLNTLYEPFQLEMNESPATLNMDFANRNSIQSRTGNVLKGTAGTAGIMGMHAYYQTDGDKYLMRTYGTKVEYFDAVTTLDWAAIETLGTGAAKMGFVTYSNTTWYGNAVDDFRSWNGTAVTTYATAPKCNAFEVYRSQCWAWGNTTNQSTLYYSDTDDFTDWATGNAGSITIDINNGMKVTKALAYGDILIVWKEEALYQITREYDEVTAADYFKVTTLNRNYGAVCDRAVQRVENDAFYLSRYGVRSVGEQENYAGSLRTDTISVKIKNSLERINKLYFTEAASVHFKDKFYLSVPIDDATVNTHTFIYDRTYGSWELYQGVAATCWCVFRESDGEDTLYFGDVDGSVYKCDTSTSDNGVAFSKLYTTPHIDFGQSFTFKRLKSVYIRGAITNESTTSLTLQSGASFQEEFTINDTHIETDSEGGLIGDFAYGDSLFGGGSADVGAAKLYRFNRWIFPKTKYIAQYFILAFENVELDSAYKIDYIKLHAVAGPDHEIPSRYSSNS
jgi:hypothetical protein